MKSLFPMATAALVAAFSAAGLLTAAADDCTGPFAPCAATVNAVCTTDPDGSQRMTYMDNGAGNTMLFQQCVGGIYVARGYPNPYDAGAPAGNPDLPFPRTTLNYSANNP
jgi:hypothetical protein